MFHRKKRPVRVQVLQRESLVAAGAPSLSVSARIVEVLDFLTENENIEYASFSEADPVAHLGLEWADVLILSKHNSQSALTLVQKAKQLGVGVIYDIDDWIFTFPKYSGGHTASAQNQTLNILALADAVTVANEELLRRVPQKLPQIKPILMPNGMWVERHTKNYGRGNIGLRPRVLFTNADFLKVQSAKDGILTALHVFFSRHPEFVLDFFGDPFPEMHSLPFLHFTNRIPYDSYMRAIVSGNYLFAITPLGAKEDEESVDFNACKNPFKYINYGTAKIPGIYSSAEIYKACVSDEETGLLVENTSACWLEAMEKMTLNNSLREKISERSHIDIKNRFHVSQSAEVLGKLIYTLVICSNNT